MSLLFSCGSHGCDVSVLDAEALLMAERQRHAWSTNERLTRGKYPRLEEQEEYLGAAYTRLTQVKRIKI